MMVGENRHSTRSSTQSGVCVCVCTRLCVCVLLGNQARSLQGHGGWGGGWIQHADNDHEDEHQPSYTYDRESEMTQYVGEAAGHCAEGHLREGHCAAAGHLPEGHCAAAGHLPEGHCAEAVDGHVPRREQSGSSPPPATHLNVQVVAGAYEHSRTQQNTAEQSRTFVLSFSSFLFVPHLFSSRAVLVVKNKNKKTPEATAFHQSRQWFHSYHMTIQDSHVGSNTTQNPASMCHMTPAMLVPLVT